MAITQTRDPEAEDLTRRGTAALADRRARGEVMTYLEDGWVYRESPGKPILRLCRLEDFEPDDYPVLD